MSQARFDAFLQWVEDDFANTLDNGSDHALFVASYLNGHFDLKVAEALQARDHSLDNLNVAVEQSLREAFANKELEKGDAEQVQRRWHELWQRFDHTTE